MSNRIQFRNATAAVCASVNEVLLLGEVCFENDTGLYKIGNGVTPWNSLPYVGLMPTFGVATFAEAADPSTPATGKLNVYAKNTGGRMMLKWKGPSGVDTAIQPFFGGNAIVLTTPSSGTVMSYVGPTPTVVGTVAHPVITGGSNKACTKRSWITSAATANAAADFRYSMPLCLRGDGAGIGGFHMRMRFGVRLSTPLQRGIFGLSNSAAAFATTQNPSTLTNFMGVIWDSADTGMQMFCSGATLGTKVPVNETEFPTTATDWMYELDLFSAPGGDKVSWRLNNLSSEYSESGEFTSPLPLSTTTLQPRAYMNNGGTAAAVSYDLSRIYLETDS